MSHGGEDFLVRLHFYQSADGDQSLTSGIVLKDLFQVVKAAGSDPKVADDGGPFARTKSKSERREGVKCLEHVALATDYGTAKSGIEKVFLNDAPSEKFLRLIVAEFSIKALRDTVLNFVGVCESGVGVKANEVRKIVDARDVAVGDYGFDGVFVAATGFALVSGRGIKESLEDGRAEFDGEFSRIAGDGFAADKTGRGERVSITCRVKGCGSGDSEPGTEMEGDGDARGKLDAGDVTWSIDGSVRGTRNGGVGAMKQASGGVERKINGQVTPGRLFDRAKAEFGHISEGNASRGDRRCSKGGGDRKRQETFVIEAGDIQAETAEIIGEEDGAADFGTDGLAERVCEREAEGERRELIVISHKAPALGKKCLDLDALLLPTLGYAHKAVREATVVHAKIGVLNGSVLPRLGAELAALQESTAAHKLEPESGVHPGLRREIESVSNNQALAGALADVGDKDAALTNFCSRWSSGVWEPDERNMKKPEVSIDEGGGLAYVNAGLRRIKLPFRMLEIANGDPRAVDQVDVRGKAFDVASFKIEGIIREEHIRAGAARNLDGAVDVVKKPVTGADVVMCLGGFDVLVVVVKLDMARSNGFVGSAVVLDVIRAQTGVSIADVHIPVGGSDITLAALRFGFQFGHAALRGRKAKLLSRRGCAIRKMK